MYYALFLILNSMSTQEYTSHILRERESALTLSCTQLEGKEHTFLVGPLASQGYFTEVLPPKYLIFISCSKVAEFFVGKQWQTSPNMHRQCTGIVHEMHEEVNINGDDKVIWTCTGNVLR